MNIVYLAYERHAALQNAGVASHSVLRLAWHLVCKRPSVHLFFLGS
jgi:hypothetical protein